MNGRAAFAPDAIAFIQSLPDNGKLSIKTTRSTEVKEGNFNLVLWGHPSLPVQSRLRTYRSIAADQLVRPEPVNRR